MKHLIAWLAAALALLAAPAGAQDARTTAALAPLRAKFESGALPNVHSLATVQDGRTLVEWYFPTPATILGVKVGERRNGPHALHDMRSVSKSVVGLLVGIAAAEGRIDVDAPVLSYFPERAELRTPERMRIRVRHLLTMTSGLEWDETSVPYTSLRNSEIQMDLRLDPVRYVLGRKVVEPPGRRFRYSGGDVAVMAEIIRRATGKDVDGYAREKLFKPMAFAPHEWVRGFDRKPVAWAGLRLGPADMLKLGRLVLDKGRWNGRQLVPASWVAQMTAPQVATDIDRGCAWRYGYFWWVSEGCPGALGTRVVAALGNGGQSIWIVPSRDLVIAVTAGNYDNPKGRTVTAETYAAVMAAVR